MSCFLGFVVKKDKSWEETNSKSYLELYEKLTEKYGSKIVHDVQPDVCCGDPYSVLILGYNVTGKSYEQILKLDIKKLYSIKEKLNVNDPITFFSF